MRIKSFITLFKKMRSPLEDLKSREIIIFNILNIIDINITETLILMSFFIIIIKSFNIIVISNNVILDSSIIYQILYSIFKDNVLKSLGFFLNKNSIIILSIMIYIRGFKYQ